MSGLTVFDRQMQFHNSGGDNFNFQAARQDYSSSTVQYDAWLAHNGSFVIMKRDLSDTSNVTIKYYIGDGKIETFSTSWTSRASLGYRDYDTWFSKGRGY